MLGIAPEKITTIHSGIADAFFDPPAERVDEVRARYGLERPFVLFVGTIEPRKNLDLLLDAFESLPAGAARALSTGDRRTGRMERGRAPWSGCAWCATWATFRSRTWRR